MQSPAPLSFVLSRAKAARRPMGIYFYDDHVNGKMKELRRCLEKGCQYEAGVSIAREALRIANSKTTGQWFDKYCSIVSDISSREFEEREHLFCYFSEIVRKADFEPCHLDHVERMLSSLDREHSHYGLFLFNRLMSARHERNSQWDARRALPESEAITQAYVDAMCRLVTVIVSKCNGTSEDSISMLSLFFAKKSFSLEAMLGLEDALSGVKGYQIPSYLEKVKSTFA